MRQKHLIASTLWLVLLGLALPALAAVGLDPSIEGVVSLTPVTGESYIAVQLELGPGEAVSGLRFYNNDGSATFPAVLLVEGSPTGELDPSNPLASLADVTGNSLGWSEIEFPVPIGDPGGGVFAVFRLPAFDERDDAGVGGGAGLGYRVVENAPPAYLSPDGVDWVRLSPRTELAVEPIVVGGSQAKMAGNDRADGKAAVVYRTALMPAVPNPANPATNIRFSLAQPMRVQFTIYNQRGARVTRLYEGKLPAGEHLLKWRGQDDGGHEVASGVYFVRMKLRDQALSQRVTIVR